MMFSLKILNKPGRCYVADGRLHLAQDTRTLEPGLRQTKPVGQTGCPESWHNKPKIPTKVP